MVCCDSRQEVLSESTCGLSGLIRVALNPLTSSPTATNFRCALQDRVPVCLSVIPSPESDTMNLSHASSWKRFFVVRREHKAIKWKSNHGMFPWQNLIAGTEMWNVCCARGEIYTGLRMLGRNASDEAWKLLLSCSLYHRHARQSQSNTWYIILRRIVGIGGSQTPRAVI
jgi:hypothetical protein